ncbi:phage tail spike protein [Aquibacillus saliphilus]|uniref:phage tail spike protein n=1 Tax=Aquibacillus saliphilus TaxID=1909422 RepID=UPI001CF052F3|nr:phage tail spike protein [Aquibacillus saliphilus]
MDITKNDIRIFLHKPNRDSLGEISIFKNPQHKPILGKVNELTFTLPHFDDNENDNKYFNLIRERYLLKVKYLNKEEWYIVDDITKSGSREGNEKQIKAFLLPYEMRGDRLFSWDGVLVNGEYRKESLTIEQITNNVIAKVAWTLDYVDIDLFDIYRFFDFSDNITVLEALYEIANEFNAIILWDTENRTFGFYHQDNYGIDKGILLSQNKYLKSIEDQIKPNDIITQLIPVGKDGITINSLNSTGSSYLMDFSYFMQPFKPSAKYWSDIENKSWSDIDE